MFGWKRKIEGNIKYLEDGLRNYRTDYWELRSKHNRLLKHLSLTEEVVREHTILKKIKEG